MENQERRELIERVWDALISIMGSAADVNVYDHDELFDALAAQPVIECEVEHFTPLLFPSAPYTEVYIEDDDGEAHSLSFEGIQGREGKALGIFLPLKAIEEE